MLLLPPPTAIRLARSRRLWSLLTRRRNSVLYVTVVIVKLFFIRTSAGVHEGSAALGSPRCPPHYWDVPSANCSAPLYAVLERIGSTDSDLTTTDIADRICQRWRETRVCYQQLLRLCGALVPGAFDEISAHADRLTIFSDPCREPSQHGLLSIECFLPFVPRIQTCTEAFDKQFKTYVAQKQFNSACKVVSVTIKCYHAVKTKVQSSCRQFDAVTVTRPASSTSSTSSSYAVRFDDSYVRPFLEQTKTTVLSFCSLHPPYDGYYNRQSQLNCHRLNTALLASFVLASHRF